MRVPKVLLVDDDEDYTHFVRRLLLRMGVDGPIDVVHDEGSAIDALSRAQYDIVVSDYELKPGNGLRVLEQVRRLNPKAQRILLTSAPDRAQRDAPHHGQLAHGIWDKRWELGTIRDQLRSLFQASI